MSNGSAASAFQNAALVKDDSHGSEHQGNRPSHRGVIDDAVRITRAVAHSTGQEAEGQLMPIVGQYAQKQQAGWNIHQPQVGRKRRILASSQLQCSQKKPNSGAKICGI